MSNSRPVEIGSRYTGKPEGFADTRTGVYWESLPRIEGDCLRIQRALLHHASTSWKIRWPRSFL